MKVQISRSMLFMALVAGLMGCGSVADEEVQSAQATRAITGLLPPANAVATATKGNMGGECAADAVLATDVSGTTTSAVVEEDCSFRLSLVVGKTYALSLTRNNEFIATLLFRSADGFDASKLTLEDGSEISLGNIIIAGSSAFPESEEQTDELAGEVRSESDEHTGDIGETPLSPGEPYLVKVSPRNGASGVAVDDPIAIQASCPLDQQSIRKVVFNIGDTEGNHVICDMRLMESPDEIVCEHDDFLPQMTYTLTLEGLHCLDEEDGAIRSLTWHFKTK